MEVMSPVQELVDTIAIKQISGVLHRYVDKNNILLYDHLSSM
jgi:hypothetical protein